LFKSARNKRNKRRIEKIPAREIVEEKEKRKILLNDLDKILNYNIITLIIIFEIF